MLSILKPSVPDQLKEKQCSADSCVRKRGVRVTGLSKLIFCVVWVIWGLADMVRAGVSSADLSTPFWGVKRGFRG